MSLFSKKRMAEKDFCEENLPSTRREVFFDVVKIRFRTFINLGLLLFLFALPLIAASFIKDLILNSIHEDYINSVITAEELNGLLKTTSLFYYLFRMIGYVILGVGFSGALRVIRKIVWDEPLFFAKDFSEGIRLNVKHYAIYFSLMGLFGLLGRMALFADVEKPILKLLPISINLFVFLPAMLYALTETQIYTVNPFREYKAGLILYIKTFPKTLLATVIFCLPMLFELIGLIVLKHVIISVFIIFIFPFVLTGETLYFMSGLDECINKEQYPSIYRKGLYNKTSDR